MFHTVKLSKSDPTPLYMQLACELAKLIQADLLSEGTKLPTIRLLSNRLSINRDTVVSAYKLLEQQGLVESHIGRGTYIASHNTPTTSIFPSATAKPHLCCSHLNFSDEFYPATLCQELTSQIVHAEGWEAFGDPLLRERRLLKQSAANFLGKLGIKTHFAQIRIVSSIDDFLLSLFKFSPKVGICVESIRDLSTSCYLRSIGAKLYEVPLTSEGMDLDILEKYLHSGMISYIFISSYLQNPTGISYSAENKQKLLELASRYDAYIIEDGTYCDFSSPNLHYQPLYNLCTDHRVIYLYHFSKIYLPYMRYSFVILPTLFIKRFKDDIECSFNERFLHYYLNSSALSSISTQLHTTCITRYQLLLSKLQSLNSLTVCYPQSYGIWLWCQVPDTLYDDFCQMLAKRSIIIAPGELFSTLPLKGYFRLSISDLSLDSINELATCLSSYLLPYQ